MKRTKNKSKKLSSITSSFEIVRIDPTKLLLDSDNPRFTPEQKGKSQERIIEILLEHFSLNEIADSICAAGFLPLDPIIGCREDGHIVVLEGNRRLATVLLLLKPELTPPRFVRTWDEYRKRVPADSLAAMKEIDVRVYSNRRDISVLSYLGYRHVNGVAQWATEERAAYSANLLEDKKIGWGYKEVAEVMGSTGPYIQKLYVAHRLTQQALESEIPGAEEMRRDFGILLRALQNPNIRSFLGIELAAGGTPEQSQYPATKSARDLEDFIRWTFGTDKENKILEDSRDLTKWGQVLAAEESIRYLRSAKEPNFERAYAKSGGLKEGLIESLLGAADRLEEAVPQVKEHKGDERVQRGVDRCANYLSQILTYFPEVAARQGLKLVDDSTAGNKPN